MGESDRDIFAVLSKPIQRALRERGFTSPTPPQSAAISQIMQGKNILLVAPTGTGKTEAAFLPILDKLITMREKPRGIKLLYITPLRALNRDMLERLQWWCKTLDIKLAVRHGDTDVAERGRQALVPPDILITTPETLQAILPGRVMRVHLGKVRWVVVDEVHELAGEKRGSQLTLALERLRLLTQGEFQVIGLSATVGTPELVAKFLVGEQRQCEVVEAPTFRQVKLQVLCPEPNKGDIELASKLYTYPEAAARLRLIKQLVESRRSSLVFTNTRTEAEVLANRFRLLDLNYPIGIHHGSLSKVSRIAAEKGLKDGTLTGIICTSSLELGIDIGLLDLVIQYNSPRQVTRLLQRVGRSGHRVGGTAQGVVITQDADDTLEAMVIGRRALAGELEPVGIPQKPYDVIVHQLAGLLLHKTRWYVEEAVELFSKAYPFRELTKEELCKALSYMHERYPRLAWFSSREGAFSKPQAASEFFNYYFGNLSMIPDEKQYLVLDEDGSAVGILDEAFVAEHGEIGAKFVEGGMVWRIKQIYQERIYVKKEEDPIGAIPTWVGEEIPVPFGVAMEVGYLRRLTEQKLKQGISLDRIAEDLSKSYPVDLETASRALAEVVEHVEKSIPTPTDQQVVIEQWKGYTIVSCCFGHLVNRSLSRLLGFMLSEKLGSPVGVHQDPYRIILDTDEASPEDVEKIILSLTEEDLRRSLVPSIVKTGMFRRRFLHVAKKLGAIEKDADLSSSRLSDLVKSLHDTIIFEEAVTTMLLKDADVEGTRGVLKEMQAGRIGITTLIDKEDLTPTARIGMEEIGRRADLVPPERFQRILLQSARARLLGESRTLVCTSCWNYVENRKIASLQNPSCPLCGSSRLGVADEPEETVWRLCESVRSVGESGVTKRFRRLYTRLTKTGEMVETHGIPFMVALVGRGVTPSEAEALLGSEREVSDVLLKRILDAEKRILKRRYFA